MKILIIHCLYKYKGGEDTVVEEEMKLLETEGHEVKLLLFSNTGNEFLKVIQFPFNFSSYLKTKKAIKSFNPDIVHLHNLHFSASPSVIYAIKKSNVPFVNTLHNYRLLCPSGTLFYNEKLFLNSLKQSFPWTAVRLGVYRNSKILTFWMSLSIKIHQWIGTWKLCSKYIVLTDYSKQLLLSSNFHLNENRIVVKPNFSIPPNFKNFQRSSHFLFVGRLTIEKGVRILLKAFSELNYEIRIAGDGPLKDEVLEFSKTFSNIKFLGNLTKQEVFDELQRCSALIFPSVWLEGMPLTIIEAFSTGTPVIASKRGAMDSMIVSGYNGYHFKPGSKEDLKSQISRWIELNDKRKSEFQLNASKSYQDFYFPKSNLNQLIGIYNNVLSEFIRA